MAEQIGPPGRARITRCGGCSGRGWYGRGYECPDCEGTGWQLWKACPRCGDIGWDRVGDGQYACRISCGYRWGEDDPAWQAQRLPDELLSDQAPEPPAAGQETVTVTMTAGSEPPQWPGR
jgi:hypothetical protein